MKQSSNIRFAKIWFTLLTATLLTVGAHAQAGGQPETATAKMTITGITGDNSDGSMEVAGIDQRAANPPNTSTGSTPPTYSVIITKKIDRATPRLFVTVMNGEMLREVKITWTRYNASTKLEEFSHSIRLRDVLLTSVRQRPANVSDPEARQSEEYEDLTFAVGIVSTSGIPSGSIEWTYALPGGRTIVTTQWDFRRGIEI